jgi:cyclopropane fatty-acyl-phospholipid synthase-like methyltransferase
MIETVRSLLDFSWVYESFWHAVGGPKRNRTLVRDYIRPNVGDRILDIGCGPGMIVPYLPSSEYVGLDASADYIDRARRRFPQMKFVCQRVSQCDVVERNYFDVVLALGIVHHLDDAEALTLFRIAHDAMKPGGKLVTVDGAWTENQSHATKYLLSRDRGRFIRDERGYVDLASKVFSKIKASTRQDLLRIPYTSMILVCQR